MKKSENSSPADPVAHSTIPPSWRCERSRLQNIPVPPFWVSVAGIVVDCSSQSCPSAGMASVWICVAFSLHTCFLSPASSQVAAVTVSHSPHWCLCAVVPSSQLTNAKIKAVKAREAKSVFLRLNGERRTENGERRTENGERLFSSLAFYPSLCKRF